MRRTPPPCSAFASFARAWRAWLVVLLCVLLPLRASMAAAMLCPLAGSGVQAEVLHERAGAHHLMDEAIGAHHTHDHTHDHTRGHHDSGGSPDKCNLCSAFCSATPIAGDPSLRLSALELPSATLPDPHAPAPTFTSGGQERPPRSI